MPHKRNPEGSEHLDTLASTGPGQRRRAVSRAWWSAHERDGRGWKAEWVALPEICLLDWGARCSSRSTCCPA